MSEAHAGQARPASRERFAAVGLKLLGLAPLAGMFLGTCLLRRVTAGRPLGGGAFGPLLAVLVLAETGYLVLQTLLWLRYRPRPQRPTTDLPRLSVVIPAFNEGPMVERSILSVAEADYPHDRLEIIVVDDGSRDDTYFHMRKLRAQYPALVRVIHFRGNQGKRAALRAGFTAATGAIVLTLDSDSEITRATLREMVAPFADAQVGAVAGRVRVLNSDTIIGRMLDVQFTMSFDFHRAAQSSYGTVMVCPGALSAFRRAVILPHLARWTEQRFLGRPVGHGEDQALTNVVLAAGYDTLYQATASVRTLVPTRFRQLWRMLLRWDRSFIVEGFSFARFMFRRRRGRGRTLPIIGFLCSNVRLVTFLLLVAQVPRVLLADDFPAAALLGAGLATAACSSVYYLRTERSARFLYGALYALYALLFLQWTLPWAAVTVRDERWGTR
jgi:hyaluronan synthase